MAEKRKRAPYCKGRAERVAKVNSMKQLVQEEFALYDCHVCKEPKHNGILMGKGYWCHHCDRMAMCAVCFEGGKSCNDCGLERVCHFHCPLCRGQIFGDFATSSNDTYATFNFKPTFMRLQAFVLTCKACSAPVFPNHAETCGNPWINCEYCQTHTRERHPCPTKPCLYAEFGCRQVGQHDCSSEVYKKVIKQLNSEQC